MKQAYPQLSVDGICWLFGITRQAFYKHYRREKKNYVQTEVIIKMIEQIRKIHPRMGTRKMIVLLETQFKAHGIKMGRDSLFDLLNVNGMLIRPRKRKWITTWSKHPYKKYKNLIKDLEVERVNQVWVSDITYLQTKAGHLYLSFITDAYSRKVVGYDVADNLESVNALQALKMSIQSLPEGPVDLIHHSDRGSQYCCHDYVEELQKKGIQISMTQNGDPLENPVAERLNGIVKNEYLVYKSIKSKAHAKEILKETIAVYNKLRPHMSIEYKTPQEVYEKNLQVSRSWKSYYSKKGLVNQ
jgi:transposase InsO family protein